MMKEFDKALRAELTKKPIEIPPQVDRRIDAVLDSLPPRMKKKAVPIWQRTLASAACLALVLVGVLPNVSSSYARAVEDIPVLGALARAFTIRDYVYDEGGFDLDADIPAVEDPVNKEAESLINADIDQLTGAVIDQFYRDMEFSPENGHGSVNINYDTVISSERWFTLHLSVTEIAASSYSYEKYYHINRTTGAYVTFGDLFRTEDYPELEALVLEQMEQRMAHDEGEIYWTDREGTGPRFSPLTDQQNFYFREDGTLVIVFDRYMVGPGYMGNPQFEIAAGEYEKFLK